MLLEDDLLARRHDRAQRLGPTWKIEEIFDILHFRHQMRTGRSLSAIRKEAWKARPQPVKEDEDEDDSKNEYAIYPKQRQIAQQLWQAMKTQLTLSDFKKISFFVQTPGLVSLYSQWIQRMTAFVRTFQKKDPGFLGDLPAAARVYKASCTALQRFELLRRQIVEEPSTLFLVVCDEPHWSSTPGGYSDVFINDPVLRTFPNVLRLFVDATPYCLQTQQSQILSQHEILWFNEHELTNQKDPWHHAAYYGVSYYLDRLNCGELEGSICSDDLFEDHVCQILEDLSEKGLKMEAKLVNRVRTQALIYEWAAIWMKDCEHQGPLVH